MTASFLAIPPMINCFSKALLVFRTRLPRVRYVQERPRNIRIKYGVDEIMLVNVDSSLILNTPDMGRRLLVLAFFVVLFSLIKSLTDSFFDFFADFVSAILARSSAHAFEHVA